MHKPHFLLNNRSRLFTVHRYSAGSHPTPHASCDTRLAKKLINNARKPGGRALLLFEPTTPRSTASYVSPALTTSRSIRVSSSTKTPPDTSPRLTLLGVTYFLLLPPFRLYASKTTCSMLCCGDCWYYCCSSQLLNTVDKLWALSLSNLLYVPQSKKESAIFRPPLWRNRGEQTPCALAPLSSKQLKPIRVENTGSCCRLGC